MGLCKHLHAWHFSAGPSCRMQRGAADQHSADRPRWEGGSGCTGFSCLKWDRGSSPWPSLFIAYTALCFNDQLIIVSILVTPCIPLLSLLPDSQKQVTQLLDYIVLNGEGLKGVDLLKRLLFATFIFGSSQCSWWESRYLTNWKTTQKGHQTRLSFSINPVTN